MEAPPWLADLAEVVSGLRLTSQGRWTLQRDSKSMRQTLHDLAGDDDLSRFGRWYAAESATRAISPRSSVTVPEFVEQRLKENTAASVEDAWEIDPGNPLILASLAKFKADKDKALFFCRPCASTRPDRRSAGENRARAFHCRIRLPRVAGVRWRNPDSITGCSTDGSGNQKSRLTGATLAVRSPCIYGVPRRVAFGLQKRHPRFEFVAASKSAIGVLQAPHAELPPERRQRKRPRRLNENLDGLPLARR